MSSEQVTFDGQVVIVERDGVAQTYSPGMLELLRKDLGDKADSYSEMIAQLASLYEPPTLPTREELYKLVNALRDQKETEGFVFGGKLFESDERSVARISNAALTAQSMLAAGQPFSIEWTAADNTTLMLVDSDMLAFQGTLTLRASRLHAHARALKDRIANATTEEEANEVYIYSGWPDE